MKKIIILALMMATTGVFSQVGIGTTSPHASAVLDLTATDKGLLLPRVANTAAIPAPTNGMMIYDLSANCTKVYANGAWSACLSSGTTPSVTANCNANGFVGSFVSGMALSGASFSVTLTNNSFSSASITFAAADLVLSGTTGLTVGTPTGSPALSAGVATINSGASVIVTYPITGTPGSAGTLTGTWNKVSLSCTQTKGIGLSDATFTLPQSKYVVSVSDGTPITNVQGYIDNTANQFVINVPYTSGSGSYSAYTSSVVTGAAGQGGDVNGFSISYPAGTFSATGTIPVTVTVDGDGTYSAKKQLFGVQETIATIPFNLNGNAKGNIILGVIGGIPDRAFGQTINGANNHNFIYLPVTAADGNTWLNHNLGAHYSNMNHGSFNPTQQATSATDHLAYGSLFQWGRKADGHELITYTNSTTGTAVNGTTSTNSNNPTDALFILEPNSPYDWRTSQDDTLWATASSANNPCPVGYKLPTNAQLTTLVSASTITNSATAASSAMKFTVPGYRSLYDGSLGSVGSTGYYWNSSVSGTNASLRYFVSGGTSTNSDSRALGFTVRCIKD